jgi:hypothetical protein
MAKLTEAYLRKLIKEAVSDLEDELFDVGEEELQTAIDQNSLLYGAIEDLEGVIEDAKEELEEDSTNRFAARILPQLQYILHNLDIVFNTIDKQTGAMSNKQRSMYSTALKTGFAPGNMNSPANDPQLRQGMDESRKRRTAPKRK